MCDDIADITNGNRTPNIERVMCGEKVTYTCNEGFSLVGVWQIGCEAGGQLRGQAPRCNISGDIFYFYF